jgi:DNA-binding XRE family transcriptional regulator
MRCLECDGEKLERRVIELTTKVGAHTVVDRSVTRPVCMPCGEYTVPAATLEQVELRAAIVAFTEAPSVSGAMLRFARKALGLKQAELGARIGATLESVSRWEREERPMELWLPLAVLGLVREKLMPPPSGVELMRTG